MRARHVRRYSSALLGWQWLPNFSSTMRQLALGSLLPVAGMTCACRMSRWAGSKLIRLLLLEPFRRRPVTEEKTECVMDWNRIEGNWMQFKGRAKEKWGRLTDDDLDVINGRQEQLEGKIQERYGLAKDQAKKDVEAWFNSLP